MLYHRIHRAVVDRISVHFTTQHSYLSAYVRGHELEHLVTCVIFRTIMTSLLVKRPLEFNYYYHVKCELLSSMGYK